MADGEPGKRMKGGLMMAARKTIKHDLRQLDTEEVLESMSPAARQLMTRRFLATDWYSVEAVDEVITRVARHVGMKPQDYALHLGRGSAHQSAGRLGWTLVTLFGSPQRLADYVPKYWSRLYDSGRVRMRYDTATSQLTMSVRDWHGHSVLSCFCPLGTIVELSDHFKEPKLASFEQIGCVARGDGECLYRLQYAT